jgi:hypothetical protein
MSGCLLKIVIVLLGLAGLFIGAAALFSDPQPGDETQQRVIGFIALGLGLAFILAATVGPRLWRRR